MSEANVNIWLCHKWLFWLEYFLIFIHFTRRRSTLFCIRFIFIFFTLYNPYFIDMLFQTFCSKLTWCFCPFSTSVLFVSITFIVLMIISLAWLVFYYIQRLRNIHAKDKLSVSRTIILISIMWRSFKIIVSDVKRQT